MPCVFQQQKRGEIRYCVGFLRLLFSFIYLLFGLGFCPSIFQFIHLPPNYNLKGVAAVFAEKIDLIVVFFFFFLPKGLIK